MSDLEIMTAIDVPWFVHAVAASVPVALAMTYYGTFLYNVHVLLMSVAFLLVMPEGMILAVKAIKHRNRPKIMKTHMYLQMLSLILTMIGVLAMFAYRQIRGKHHFNSLHSWLGLSAICLVQIVSLVGLLLSYVIPKSRRSSMPLVMALHKLGGRLVFFLGCLSIFQAMKIFSPHSKKNKGVIAYVLASVIVSLAVGLLPILTPSANVTQSLMDAMGTSPKGIGEGTFPIVSGSAVSVAVEGNSDLQLDKKDQD